MSSSGITTFEEKFDSREQTVSNENPTVTLTYTVQGSEDDAEVRAAAANEVPEEYAGLPLQDYRITPQGGGVWEVSARYGKQTLKPPGTVQFSFDTGGGTRKIYQSLRTNGSYGAPLPGTETSSSGTSSGISGSVTVPPSYRIISLPKATDLGIQVCEGIYWSWINNFAVNAASIDGACTYVGIAYAYAAQEDTTVQVLIQILTPQLESPPDFKQAIGVNGDSVEGCDVTVPQFTFQETHYFSPDQITDNYILLLHQLTGSVNIDPWRVFAAGEVLFLGASGSQRGVDDWEITYKFAASPNQEPFMVGEVFVSQGKRGFDYLWVRYKDSVSVNSIVKTPRFAYVEQVYPETDFALLALS
jgi:hypothetical protein